MIAEIAYGHKVLGPDEAYPQIAERVTEILVGSGTAGLNLVDIFPICMLDWLGLRLNCTHKSSLVMHLPEWFPGAWLIRYGNSTSICGARTPSLQHSEYCNRGPT